MASNHQKPVKITSVLSSLFSFTKKIEELLANIQSELARGGISSARTAVLLSSFIEELLVDVLNTRATINNLEAPQNQAAAVAPPSPSFSPQNQGVALSLLQQSQVNPPRGTVLQNQVGHPVSRLRQWNITQQNQAAAVAPPSPSISPQNQGGALSLLQQSQVPPPGTVLQNQVGHPVSRLRQWNIPQQNQAAAASSSKISIPQGQKQTFQQLLNPETNVGSGTKKRRWEALLQNNELPERLKQFDSDLIQRILAEIVDRKTNVKWGDIAGLEDAKNCVLETVLLSVQNPRIFQGVRSIGKGILLFGPPGSGKTMIGKAIAGEMQAKFFNVFATSLTIKTLVEAEQLITALFALARHFQPSVVFLDDIDALLSRQSSYYEEAALRRVKMQILTEMQDIDSGSEQITVIGATNRPQDLDEAARRRFSKRLYIPVPCKDARRRIVLNTLERVKHNLSEQDLSYICSLTNGYSGSDMKNLIDEALMGPVRDATRVRNKDIGVLKREELRSLALQDFTNAWMKVRSSVWPQEIVAYEDWNAKFGSK